MSNYKKEAPTWAPDAIPTKRGWVDKKTGELLVAIRGIELDPKKEKPTQTKTTKKAPTKKTTTKKKTTAKPKK